jgi:hypothetical protein
MACAKAAAVMAKTNNTALAPFRAAEAGTQEKTRLILVIISPTELTVRFHRTTQKAAGDHF